MHIQQLKVYKTTARVFGFILASAVVLVLAKGQIVSADQTSSNQKTQESTLSPDNTGVNKRDREQNKLTAEHQAQSSREDEEITRHIREELVKNEKLSMYGQNVKIITLGGIVTLRGPVKNQFEKDLIVSSAQKQAGVQTIHNELEIAK